MTFSRKIFGAWFDVVVTAFITSMKLCFVEPG